MDREDLIGFADWISNNWLIAVKDGLWKVDTKDSEYQDIGLPTDELFDSNDLVEMYLSKKGEV